MASEPGRGAQVILDGAAQALARGAGAGDLATNANSKRALEQAGVVSDGYTPDGSSRTGLPADDEVLLPSGTSLSEAVAGTQAIEAARVEVAGNTALSTAKLQATEAARAQAQQAASTAAASVGAAYLQQVARVVVPGLADADGAGDFFLDVALRPIEYRRANGSGARFDPLSPTLYSEVLTAASAGSQIIQRIVVPGSAAVLTAATLDNDLRITEQTTNTGDQARAVPGVGLDPVVTASKLASVQVGRAVVPGVGDVTDALLDPDLRASEAKRLSDGAGFTAYRGAMVQVGKSQDPLSFDLVVYGGTLSGIMAAKRAALRGLTVCIIEPTGHLGGVVAGGLVVTDTPIPGTMNQIGGDTRQFFLDIRHEYNAASVNPLYIYEPKVAERIANRTALATGGTIVLNSPLSGPGQLNVEGGRIRAMSTAIGWVRGRYFVDASYEMDLARHAGAPYRRGREGVADFNEISAGFQPNNAFVDPAGPYDFTGNTYPLTPKPDLPAGTGDDCIQAYSFRHVITNTVGNTIPFPKPADYDPARYTMLKQMILRRGVTVFNAQTGGGGVMSAEQIPNGNGKHCTNNQKLISLELGAYNKPYPLGTWSQRRAVEDQHFSWQAGFYWWLQNDPACPPEVQASIQGWGLPADEFQDSRYAPGWGHQLYLRQTIRLNGLALLQQQNMYEAPNNAQFSRLRATSIIGWRYYLDCHPVQLYREGNTFAGEGPTGTDENNHLAYEIPAEVMMPSAGPVNLLVSVNISCTHVAWMPTRMEPVFMMCGEAAGEIAAQCATAGDIPVAQYSYPQLAAALTERGAILKLPA